MEEKSKTASEKPKKKDPREKLLKPNGKPLILKSSPHLLSNYSVEKIMRGVLFALLPTTILGVVFFGWRALLMILVGIISCVLTEVIFNLISGKKFKLTDGTSVLTGLLLVLTLPPSFPISGVILGSVVAIFIGKMIFGGLGYNIFNPALLGRAFLQASYPVKMTTWTLPKFVGADAVTGATPLGLFKFEHVLTNIKPLILGNVGGSIGETSAIAIILGGIFILIKKYADWRIPLSYIGTVFILGGIFWLIDPVQHPNPIFHVFAGGLMLGAFFMATDMVTSPITNKGSWIFGIGAGVVLITIRLFGGLPEGVMYSIIFMNGLVPLINRYTQPKVFGEIKK